MTKDWYPLPYIEDLLDKLHRVRVFTKLDLASGYHQVQVHSDDCYKTVLIASTDSTSIKSFRSDMQMHQLRLYV